MLWLGILLVILSVLHSELIDTQNCTSITLEGSRENVGNVLNAKENKKVSSLSRLNVINKIFMLHIM